MALKTSKYTPGVSRYNQPRERCSWYWTVWPRSLKIGPTSQPQDIARCYEAMTRGIYAANLKRKEDGMRDAWGPREEVKPTK